MKITCSDLTYLEYVRIVVGNFDKVPKLNGLSEEELKEISAEIITEFQELTGDHSFSNYKKLYEDLAKYFEIYEKYSMLYNVLILLDELSPTVYEVLDELKVKYTEADTLQTIIEKVFARAKKAELQYKSVEKQIEKIKEQNKKNIEVTEASLIKVIAAVSAGLMFSVSVNDNAVVVAEYINILNKQSNKHGIK